MCMSNSVPFTRDPDRASSVSPNLEFVRVRRVCGIEMGWRVEKVNELVIV